MVFDDVGVFHPLGLTFFWALYGWKFEREKVLAHLAWLQTKRFDYLRILGEVDWEGRTIDPQWPDYEANLQGFVDAAYAHGMRVEITIVGGRSTTWTPAPCASFRQSSRNVWRGRCGAASTW